MTIDKLREDSRIERIFLETDYSEAPFQVEACAREYWEGRDYEFTSDFMETLDKCLEWIKARKQGYSDYWRFTCDIYYYDNNCRYEVRLKREETT